MLLDRLVVKSRHLGYAIDLSEDNDWPTVGAVNRTEYNFLLRSLADSGWIDSGGMDQYGCWRHTRVQTAGFEQWERTQQHIPDVRDVFVAMSFRRELDHAFDDGVRPALEGLGYRAIRVDRTEVEHLIDDQIQALIRRSRFVVADFTDNRAGVYFEAGFARGLGRPVLFTCSAADLKSVHFDIQHFQFLTWHNSGELRSRLAARVEARFGRVSL